MKVKEFVRKNVEAITTSIKFFKEQPLDSLGEIFPVGMVCTSAIGFVVALILFIAEGGFSNQISAIEGDFFGGISKCFTSGTASALTTGIVSSTILLLLLAEFVILIISYLKTETKAKKIIVSVCLGIGLILLGIASFILGVGYNMINVSEKTQMKVIEILSAFDGVEISTIVNGLIIIAAIGMVALVIFIVLMLISQHRWMIKQSAVALLITYIIVPLILLLIENIVPMFVGIIALAVIGGLLFLICKIFASGGESEESSSGSSYVPTSNNSRNTSYNTCSEDEKPKGKYQKEKIYDLNTTFWRDKGGCGFSVPMADCVYFKNAWGEKAYVCTVEDFEKGNVAIINKKVRVMSVAGCKSPKR